MPHSTLVEDDTNMSQPPPSSPPVPSSMIQASADTMDTTQDEEAGPDEQVDLLKLFDKDNVESEDEFNYSSSAIAKNMSNLAIPSSSPPPLTGKLEGGSRYDDPDIMLAFYRRLFPFRPMWQWLNHGVKPGPDTANREIAYTLQSDVYLRYQSFVTSDLWRKDVLRQNPLRFEIGPVYTSNPRDRKSLRKASAFKPISKELCFDLDLTDYDDIRTCCSEANICLKCWQWATMAVKVVDTCLREDFGFEHILWVYSGRRGVHGWVCDKRAREMNDEKRRAIAGWLGVVAGKSDSKLNLRRPLHPHIERSMRLLEPHFRDDILKDQDPWRTATQTENLLTLLPDKPLCEALKKKWSAAPGRSSALKWGDVKTVAESGASKNLDGKALQEARQDIVLKYTYPRLDIEVSKKLNHLLKSPFVIHPKTGRICVPIPLPPRRDENPDWTALERFNPLTVPNVIDILNDIDAWDTKNLERLAKEKDSVDNQSNQTQDSDSASQEPVNTAAARSGNVTANGKPLDRMQDYEKTALKPYVDYFKSFVASLLKSELRSSKRDRDGEGDGDEGITNGNGKMNGEGGDAMEF